MTAAIALPPGCKPSVALSTDETRPALCHAYLREREDGWWLCATDAYIAFAVKVETTGDPREGWVHRSVVEFLEDEPYGWPRRQAEQMSDKAWAYRTGAGRSEVAVDIDGSYPDFEVLAVWSDEPATAVPSIGMRPALTVRLHEAINASLGGVQLDFLARGENDARGPYSLMRVTGGIHHPDRRGIQCPVRMDEALGPNQQRET